MAVDADTKKYLEEVKKGKPRRFVLICKGAKIVSMVVYKKGTVDKYKKQAKKEGKGDFYHGVVDGKGVSISFKMQSSDGYDKPPGKELILKDFLKTEAGMQFHPTYEIVEELPQVDDTDDAAPATDAGGTAVEAVPPPPPASGGAPATSEESVPPAPAAPVPAGDVAELFKTRLRSMLAQIKQAAGTPGGEEAKLKASQAGALASKQAFHEALALLDQTEQALQRSASSFADAAGTDATPIPPAAPPTDVRLADVFKARLAALVPQVKQATGTPAGDEAKLRASEAGMFAHKKDFTKASQLLDQVEQLLKAGEPTATASGEADSETAGSSAAAQHAWTQARDGWRQAIEIVDAQINAVRSKMLSSGNDDLKKVADRGLPALTDNHKTPVMRALIELDSSQGDARRAAAVKARSAVQAFARHIRGSAMVRVLDANSKAAFGVELTIADVVGKGLDKLDQALDQLG